MKLPSLLVLATLLLLGGLPACTTDDPIPHTEPQADTFVAALQDGQPWREGGTAVFERSTSTWTLMGHQMPFTLHTPETLRLHFVYQPTQPLTTLMPRSAEWWALTGGDVISNSYETADSTSRPTLRITRLDAAQQLIEGTFEATLRRDAHWSKQGELMRFTQGSFRVHYKEMP